MFYPNRAEANEKEIGKSNQNCVSGDFRSGVVCWSKGFRCKVQGLGLG